MKWQLVLVAMSRDQDMIAKVLICEHETSAGIQLLLKQLYDDRNKPRDQQGANTKFVHDIHALLEARHPDCRIGIETLMLL